MADTTRRATIILQAKDEASAVLQRAGQSTSGLVAHTQNSAKIADQAARSYMAMATSLHGATSKQQVASSVMGNLNQKFSAGLITSQQYSAAAEQVGLKSGLMSKASLDATQKISTLTGQFAQGKIDAGQFASGIDKVSVDLNRQEKAAENAARRTEMFGNIAKVAALAGVAALGAALLDAVKSAAEFEKKLALIRGLTDTTSAQFAGMSQAVLGLTRTIPKSAAELADALYFISSSGHQGADAMKILEISAKASAAGLGETKVIADAVTSTLNAYRLGADEAARVTDVLTNAVIQGKGEPAEFAGSLGRILPIASQAGVSIEQVAASMSVMTRIGLSAEESATALRGTLAALLAPGKQAREALLSIGFSVDSLRQSIREKGLLETLRVMMERTQGNVETLDLIIPNVRALTGVLATAGSQSEEYARVLETMNQAAGRTEKAFGVMADTFDAKLKKFENAVDGVKIAVGTGLLPTVSNFLEEMTAGIHVLDGSITQEEKLATALRKTTQMYGENSAQVEKVKKVVEEYLRTKAMVNELAQREIEAISQVAQAYLRNVTGISKLTDQMYGLNSGFDEGARFARAAADAVDENSAALEFNADAAASTKAAQEKLKDEFDALKFVMAGAVGKEMTDYNDKQDELRRKATEVKTELDKLMASQGALITTQTKGSLSANELNLATLKLAGAQQKLSETTDPLKQAKLSVEIEKLQGKIGGAASAVSTYVDNSKKIGELTGQYDDINSEIAANAQAHDDATKRILFDIAAQQLAVGGLSDVEIEALRQISVEWGLQDAKTAEAVANVLLSTNQLAKDQNIQTFTDNMTGALNDAKNSTDTTAAAVDAMSAAMGIDLKAAADAHAPLKTAASETATHVDIKSKEVTVSVQTMLDQTAGIIQQAPAAFEPMKAGFSSLSSAAADAANDVIDKINDMLSAIAGVRFNFPSVPSIPTGGGGGGGTGGAGGGGGGGGTTQPPTTGDGGGGGSGGLCFIAETLITMADGATKPIEQIVSGDEVLSFDEQGELLIGVVTETYQHDADKIHHLNFTSGLEVSCTGEHPFYAPYLQRHVPRIHGDFIEAQYLEFGDFVEAVIAGRPSGVTVMSTQIVAAPQRVYNFNVASTHTYIANGLMVHNLKAQRGADFIVPPGYGFDAFPMGVSSGERVIVIPAAQNQRRGDIAPLNVTMNIYATPRQDVTALANEISRRLGSLADQRRRTI